MNLEEIRSSGMLELYVLGRLDPADTKLVEDAMVTSQDLRFEIAEIEKVLEYYAVAHGVNPSPGLKDKLLQDISGSKVSQPQPDPSTKTGSNNWLLGLLGLAALALAFGYWNQSKKLSQLQNNIDAFRISCDSIQDVSQSQVALLNQLNDPNNDIIQVTPTEKFPETNLYFHHNPVSRQNFIQVKNLPAINNNQSYQLWSLKGNQAPIPLDVFRADGQLIIPVRHENSTNTYAITIENRDGAQSPDLSNLIGTFSVS